MEKDTGLENPLIGVTETIEDAEPFGERTRLEGLANREKSGEPPAVTLMVQVAVLVWLPDAAWI
jgi:hypothetical protein